MQDTFLIYHDTGFVSTENFNEHISVDKIKLWYYNVTNINIRQTIKKERKCYTMYTKQDIVTVAAPIDSRISRVITIKRENDEIVVKIENVAIKDVVFSDKKWGFVVEITRVIYRKPLSLKTFREVLRSQPTEVTTIEMKIFESEESQKAMQYYHGRYDKNAPSECMNKVNKILK